MDAGNVDSMVARMQALAAAASGNVAPSNSQPTAGGVDFQSICVGLVFKLELTGSPEIFICAIF